MRIVLLALLLLPLAPAEIRFNRDIRPILSENCFACHGPDSNARQAGLRLDIRDEALARQALVPGDLAASKLAIRVGHQNEALRMPPVYSNKSLSEGQKQLLVEWISQGAEYEPHWAYISPERPQSAEGRSAIDGLINQRLAELNLNPAAKADRRTLARRLSFDLTGLPAERSGAVAEFLDGNASYAELLDSYLGSPRFGERMAVHWLDLVRYADSVGYHSDVEISMSPYRDYVIRAFNDNKPFDQFTVEQLAGDLLADRTQEQLVASAYNRLNRMTNEGGSQPKEYLAKYASDRIRTTSAVWLGSTLGCAECHDHKFDPFAHRDFYRFGAFFADIEEVGVYGSRFNWGPSVRALNPDQEQNVRDLEARIARLRAEGFKGLSKADVPDFDRRVRERVKTWNAGWLEEARADCSHPDIDGCDQFAIEINSNGAFVDTILGASGEKPREADIRLRSHVFNSEVNITGFRLEALAAKGFEDFGLSEFEVRVDGVKAKIASFDALPSQSRVTLLNTVDGNNHSTWGGSFDETQTYEAIFLPERPVRVGAGARLEVRLLFNGRTARQIPGRLRVTINRSGFPDFPMRLTEGTFKQVTEENSNWQEIRRLRREINRIEDSAVECLVTQAVDDPRVLRVLPRGNWMDDSGEAVEPGVPHFLPQIETEGRGANRLDLARWMTRRDNPLTARVFVNRLWRMFFGSGLSKVLDDIGSQGEPPANQELLDWLAVEFMESGWDVKHIIRTMLLSDTYQRSSEPTDALLAADPYNRLHGRQSMWRVEAEFVRDAALKVSGLMNERIGGPSAKPYQPAGYYQELNFPKREYEADHGADQYRRGLYTHWQRTFLHPSMAAFDAPPREECTAQREISNTPLQALALLNDPTYVETAEAAADWLLGLGPNPSVAALFDRMFLRAPTPDEERVIANLLEKARRAGLEPASPTSAARYQWTAVARALINKHEFVMRY